MAVPTDRFEVSAALEGERLDRAVALMTGWSRAAVRHMLEEGAILLDGVRALTASERLVNGSTVEITSTASPDPPQDSAPLPPMAATPAPFDVLHADADVVVVNKPAGVVTHPGAGNRHGTLADALVLQFPDMASAGPSERPGIVHRLDRGTSGILVCARNTDAYEALVAQLASREVSRIYAALVRGHPSAARGTIDAPIGRDRRNRTTMAVVSDGRPARTHYSTAQTYAHPLDIALLRCELDTGRTHQIRVHLASIGLPLLGDLTYGVPDPWGIGRPLLHAARLSFRHPRSQAAMSFDAPLAEDFLGALHELGSDSAAIALGRP